MKTLLNSTGTKQLLINNLEGTFSLNNNVGDAWRTELKNLGYPQLTRNISLSNASHCAFTQPYAPLDDLFTLTGFGQTGILVDFIFTYLPIVSISTYTTLAILFNEPSLLIGILPGNSKFNLDFYGKALPSSGGTNRIYNGSISFTKTLFKLFSWTPRITVNITNKGYDAPSIPSFDYFPGGAYNSFITSSNSTNNLFPILGTYGINLTATPSFNFIPTTSALDIGNGSVTLSDSDYLKKYTAAVTLIAPKTTPFVNYTTSYSNNGNNELHISFNTKNGNWLATELDATQNNELIFNCLNFCSNAQITGSSILCTTGTYTVTNEATIVNWSISEGNALVTFSTNGNQITINQVNPNQSGYITLNVSYSNDRCGSATPAPKRIWVGRPDVQDQNIYGGYNNVPYNTTTTYTVTTVPGATSYYWTLSNLSTNCGCTTNSLGLTTCPNGVVLPKFAPNNTLIITTTSPTATVNWGNCIGTYSVDCVAVNSCGTDGIYYKNVNVYNPNGGGPDPCEGSLLVFPNPVNANSGEPGNISIEVIYPPIDPCDDIPLGRITNNNDVKIYDFYGNIVFSKRFDSDKIEISNVTLKKGHYILNVFTSKGFYKKEIIVVR